MTLHRFFLPPAALVDDFVEFPDAVAYQLRRVLRMRPGQRVEVLDGSGIEYLVELTELGAKVVGQVVGSERTNRETPRPIVLYQGMLKAAKFETVIQHCTEVGVGRIVPVLSARAVASEPSASRQSRFEVIAREAAEQSGRGIIPEVGPALSLADAIQRADGTVLVLYEDEHTHHLMSVDLDEVLGPISLLIGPEGGFEPEEVRMAAGSGALTVSLGPRILRAETAAIVACAMVAARLDASAA